jgi:PAS domain S-box-containing protein
MDRKVSILLIEDDALDQMALRRSVEREKLPYEIVTAGSVAAAREQLASRSYDLVIADHTLGDGTAFDIVDLFSERPVIFATGSGTETIAARALQLGARDYLIKDPDGNYLKLLPHRINMVLSQWRAERALLESEQRFRDLFENSPDAIFVESLEGVVLDANPAACQLHGLPRERLIGRPVQDLVPPAEREAVRAGFKALVKGERAKTDGFSWTSEGRAVPVEITCKRIVFSGRPALLLNARDITERRKSEEALRQARDDLEQRVAERTAELAEANKQLQMEMSQRERMQMKMLLAIELEQERIGQDLHDGICQILTGAKFSTALLGRKIRDSAVLVPEDSDSIEALIKDAIRQARGVAYGLNPVKSEEGGLMNALAVLAMGANMEPRPACAFVCKEPVLFDDHSFAAHLYRIAQEALQNAVKHAEARNITIELSERAGVVTLAVTDDGTGFSLAQNKATGMGLSNMRRRAGMIGGKIEIKPAEQGGTSVVCRVRRAGIRTESGA